MGAWIKTNQKKKNQTNSRFIFSKKKEKKCSHNPGMSPAGFSVNFNADIKIDLGETLLLLLMLWYIIYTIFNFIVVLKTPKGKKLIGTKIPFGAICF